jgi:hypothetical protein
MGVLRVIQALGGLGIRTPDMWNHPVMGRAAADECVKGWKLLFEPYSDETLYAAAVRYTSKAKDRFWPSPADLIVHCESIEQTLSGKHRPTPDEAWGALLEHLRDAANYDAPALLPNKAHEVPTEHMRWDGEKLITQMARRFVLHDDLLVRVAMEAALAAIGGWRRFADIDADRGPATAASFRRTYEAVMTRETADAENRRVVICWRLRQEDTRTIPGARSAPEGQSPRLSATPERVLLALRAAGGTRTGVPAERIAAMMRITRSYTWRMLGWLEVNKLAFKASFTSEGARLWMST